jgi:hypothetical protein
MRDSLFLSFSFSATTLATSFDFLDIADADRLFHSASQWSWRTDDDDNFLYCT